jgi:methyl-accepting chemotaxis protein
MDKMLYAMQVIDTNSEEITSINNILEEINFQTNILALNASVEASRAGVDGKGFAAVADQIRSLAEKSNASSKRTREIVENSQKSVRDGGEYAQQMAQSVRRITTAVDEIHKKTERLKTAVAGQTSSLENISAQIGELSNLAAGNLDASQIGAGASRSLEKQADALTNLAGRFILKKESDTQDSETE